MADFMEDPSIDRPVSPLYEAIRDIMAGTWPEDEYDVAESPLSYVEYKSQVSLDGEVEPVPVVVRNSTSTGATDTDFESLKSDDESDWSEREEEGDDTMNTDIGVELKNQGAAAERRRSIVEEATDGAAGAEITTRIDTVIEDEVKIRPRRNTIADEFAEGFRAEIAEELSNLVQEEPEIEAATGSKGSKTNILLPPVLEAETIGAAAVAEHTALNADKPAPPQAESEKNLPRLTIPPTPAPVPDSELTPPPIPSRSPSRPNTALANHTIFPAPSASVTSLQPLKPTVSTLSSPRSSRFFEDLATTTATSVDIASTKRQESDNLEKLKVPPAAPVEESQKKKRRGSFSCGLKLWGKGKGKKAAVVSESDNARPATGSASSTAKR